MGYFSAFSLPGPQSVFSQGCLDNLVDIGRCPDAWCHLWPLPGIDAHVAFPCALLACRAYIWFFRGSPLLVQVLFLYDGLPRVIQNPAFLLPDWACVLVAFSLNEGAYMAEIIRAGITSVDPGQMEAAKSLGMRYSLAMRRIVLPQAARVIIPPLGNEFNNMLKTTSIASVIGLLELTHATDLLGAPTFTIFELLILATLYYLLLTTLWGYVQSWIENRLDPNRTADKIFKRKKAGLSACWALARALVAAHWSVDAKERNSRYE